MHGKQELVVIAPKGARQSILQQIADLQPMTSTIDTLLSMLPLTHSTTTRVNNLRVFINQSELCSIHSDA